MIMPPHRYTRSPYTTLFRSRRERVGVGRVDGHHGQPQGHVPTVDAGADGPPGSGTPVLGSARAATTRGSRWTRHGKEVGMTGRAEHSGRQTTTERRPGGAGIDRKGVES